MSGAKFPGSFSNIRVGVERIVSSLAKRFTQPSKSHWDFYFILI
jgi:hypothetical protein